MIQNSKTYSYGPVPSRRLGKSLGINNIPAKVCTYSCVYCQVGKTTRKQHDRRFFYHPENIFQDVRARLTKAFQAAETVDYLTFVPDGEPTLDINLGKEIRLMKTSGVPVGVITNSSLIWRDDVREELGQADWVSLKIDALEEDIWKKINRPHKHLYFSQILNGIQAFAKSFSGRLATETMLVNGCNDTDDGMRQTAEFIRNLKPYRAYLTTPTRPPAEDWVRGVDEDVLNRMFHIFSARVKQVEYLIGYEGNAFASTGDIESDLLSITAVHPMRKEAVDALLSRTGSSWQVVEQLVDRGDLAKTCYDGHDFYLRKFTPKNTGPDLLSLFKPTHV
ncbi:MAG: radical SAM protein [Desulfatirhabdiaceae bacterium]